MMAAEKTLLALEQRLSRWTLLDSASPHPLWPDPSESSAFLKAVDLLLGTIRSWDSSLSRDGASPILASCLDRAHNLLQAAVFRLSDEFVSLASAGQLQPSDDFDDHGEDDDEEDIPVAQPLSDFDIAIEIFPPGVVSDLHEIAKRMVAAGFADGVCHVYSSNRREFLDESASRVGFGGDRPYSSGGGREEESDGDLQNGIEKWIQAIKLAVHVLFPSERRLADQIFTGYPSVANYCFMEVSRGLMDRFLQFADEVCVSGRSVERLFEVLRMFETLTELLPELDGLFSGSAACAFLCTEAADIRRRLGDTIRAIFREFEVAIQRDSSKPVPGGGLHPLTRYVMNYMKVACDYKPTLDVIFAPPSGGGGAVGVAPEGGLTAETLWIMELLMSNLEAKTKAYTDPAQRHLFLMNNWRYIVSKVRDSEGLASLLGAEWIRNQGAKVKQNQAWYQRSAWGKVVSTLVLQGATADASLAPRTVVREKMRIFSNLFDENVKEQSGWTVPDEQLRREIRSAVAEMVIPPYQEFLTKFRHQLSGKGAGGEAVVKYIPEELRDRLDELFGGRPPGC
ncbi:Exocyst complex component [Nymphaea thermarum]|nr:Exocyst complex component [Nymphaea thermarum]